MIGGNSRVNLDVPPFSSFRFQCAAHRDKHGRATAGPGFTDSEESADVRSHPYKILYRSGLKLKDALALIASGLDTEHTRHLVKFIESSERGICR